MPNNKAFFHPKMCSSLVLIVVFCSVSAGGANRPGWQRHEVDWRMTGGARIKAVDYPQDRPPPTFTKQPPYRPKTLRKKVLPPEAASRLASLAQQSATAPIFATVVDSPPLGGFVPWITLAITDKRFDETSMIFEAVPESPVTGEYMTANPDADYAIGIFDTGASAHVISHTAAAQASLSGPYLTSNIIEISGIVGSVDAWVSQPVGIFVDGIGAIEPNGLLYDTSGMVGEWNTAVAVGDAVGSPNLPTAIGSPLSVYYAAEFRNERQLFLTHNYEDFNGPDIIFYDREDPYIPLYPNIIPLELRPLGGVNVQYIPTIDPFNPFEFPPASPSVIIGNLSQSIFFVHSVDLYEADKSAIDKDRFMLDTGAQVTVVGSRIAARLKLDPDDPNFELPVMGITGETVIAPGFYIDAIEIPALGEWLSFTDVPIILLDVSSPEGGTLDGIIGMNLFVEFNFVLRGGGLFLQDDPTLEFGPIHYHIIADIAPRVADGFVDYWDLAVFAKAWLATKEPRSPNWDFRCDLAPVSYPDGKIDFLDFAVFAQYWQDTAL
jgi:predicted aspartyl protease